MTTLKKQTMRFTPMATTESMLAAFAPKCRVTMSTNKKDTHDTVMPALSASQGRDTKVILARKFIRTTARTKMTVIPTGTARRSAATMVVLFSN